MTTETIKINRAPVLTLWATIVAERLGYDPDTALTLGKAVAGLNAQSKGRRLVIFEKSEPTAPTPAPKRPAASKVSTVTLLGRTVSVVQRKAGRRATIKDEPIKPESVTRYLESKFGEDLAEVRNAMKTLAASYSSTALETQAFSLYEKFRPQIPEGTQGWGAKGVLNVSAIRALAKTKPKRS